MWTLDSCGFSEYWPRPGDFKDKTFLAKCSTNVVYVKIMVAHFLIIIYFTTQSV